MTSKEANFMKFSKFTIWVIRRRLLPRNTKLSLNSQKKRVPRMDTENIEMIIDCFGEKPPKRLRIPRVSEMKSINRIFFVIKLFLG